MHQAIDDKTVFVHPHHLARRDVQHDEAVLPGILLNKAKLNGSCR